jgi:hypothetical protein
MFQVHIGIGIRIAQVLIRRMSKADFIASCCALHVSGGTRRIRLEHGCCSHREIIRLVREKTTDNRLRSLGSLSSSAAHSTSREHIEPVATRVADFLRHVLIRLSQEPSNFIQTQADNVNEAKRAAMSIWIDNSFYLFKNAYQNRIYNS